MKKALEIFLALAIAAMLFAAVVHVLVNYSEFINYDSNEIKQRINGKGSTMKTHCRFDSAMPPRSQR